MRNLASEIAAATRAAPRYQRATVKAVSGSLLTVLIDGQESTLPALENAGGYTPGSLVVVARDASGSFVLGVIGTTEAPTAPPNPPPVTPPSAPQKRAATLLPTFTGSWRPGGWRSDSDVRQGDYGYGNHVGAAFYGRQLAGLHANLSETRRAVLTYRRTTGGVFAPQSPTVWTLSESSRPAGAPTRLASAAGAAVGVYSDRTASWQLPQSMTDALLSGTAGGLGIYVAGGSPYIVLLGRSEFASAFQLSVTYYTNP